MFHRPQSPAVTRGMLTPPARNGRSAPSSSSSSSLSTTHPPRSRSPTKAGGHSPPSRQPSSGGTSSHPITPQPMPISPTSPPAYYVEVNLTTAAMVSYKKELQAANASAYTNHQRTHSHNRSRSAVVEADDIQQHHLNLHNHQHARATAQSSGIESRRLHRAHAEAASEAEEEAEDALRLALREEIAESLRDAIAARHFEEDTALARVQQIETQAQADALTRREVEQLELEARAQYEQEKRAREHEEESLMQQNEALQREEQALDDEHSIYEPIYQALPAHLQHHIITPASDQPAHASPSQHGQYGTQQHSRSQMASNSRQAHAAHTEHHAQAKARRAVEKEHNHAHHVARETVAQAHAAQHAAHIEQLHAHARDEANHAEQLEAARQSALLRAAEESEQRAREEEHAVRLATAMRDVRRLKERVKMVAAAALAAAVQAEDDAKAKLESSQPPGETLASLAQSELDTSIPLSSLDEGSASPASQDRRKLLAQARRASAEESVKKADELKISVDHPSSAAAGHVQNAIGLAEGGGAQYYEHNSNNYLQSYDSPSLGPHDPSSPSQGHVDDSVYATEQRRLRHVAETTLARDRGDARVAQAFANHSAAVAAAATSQEELKRTMAEVHGEDHPGQNQHRAYSGVNGLNQHGSKHAAHLDVPYNASYGSSPNPSLPSLPSSMGTPLGEYPIDYNAQSQQSSQAQTSQTQNFAPFAQIDDNVEDWLADSTHAHAAARRGVSPQRESGQRKEISPHQQARDAKIQQQYYQSQREEQYRHDAEFAQSQQPMQPAQQAQSQKYHDEYHATPNGSIATTSQSIGVTIPIHDSYQSQENAMDFVNSPLHALAAHKRANPAPAAAPASTAQTPIVLVPASSGTLSWPLHSRHAGINVSSGGARRPRYLPGPDGVTDATDGEDSDDAFVAKIMASRMMPPLPLTTTDDDSSRKPRPPGAGVDHVSEQSALMGMRSYSGLPLSASEAASAATARAEAKSVAAFILAEADASVARIEAAENERRERKDRTDKKKRRNARMSLELAAAQSQSQYAQPGSGAGAPGSRSLPFAHLPLPAHAHSQALALPLAYASNPDTYRSARASEHANMDSLVHDFLAHDVATPIADRSDSPAKILFPMVSSRGAKSSPNQTSQPQRPPQTQGPLNQLYAGSQPLSPRRSGSPVPPNIRVDSNYEDSPLHAAYEPHSTTSSMHGDVSPHSSVSNAPYAHASIPALMAHDPYASMHDPSHPLHVAIPAGIQHDPYASMHDPYTSGSGVGVAQSHHTSASKKQALEHDLAMFHDRDPQSYHQPMVQADAPSLSLSNTSSAAPRRTAGAQEPLLAHFADPRQQQQRALSPRRHDPELPVSERRPVSINHGHPASMSDDEDHATFIQSIDPASPRRAASPTLSSLAYDAPHANAHPEIPAMHRSTSREPPAQRVSVSAGHEYASAGQHSSAPRQHPNDPHQQQHSHAAHDHRLPSLSVAQHPSQFGVSLPSISVNHHHDELHAQSHHSPSMHKSSAGAHGHAHAQEHSTPAAQRSRSPSFQVVQSSGQPSFHASVPQHLSALTPPRDAADPHSSPASYHIAQYGGEQMIHSPRRADANLALPSIQGTSGASPMPTLLVYNAPVYATQQEEYAAKVGAAKAAAAAAAAPRTPTAPAGAPSVSAPAGATVAAGGPGVGVDHVIDADHMFASMMNQKQQQSVQHLSNAKKLVADQQVEIDRLKRDQREQAVQRDRENERQIQLYAQREEQERLQQEHDEKEYEASLQQQVYQQLALNKQHGAPQMQHTLPINVQHTPQHHGHGHHQQNPSATPRIIMAHELNIDDDDSPHAQHHGHPHHPHNSPSISSMNMNYTPASPQGGSHSPGGNPLSPSSPGSAGAGAGRFAQNSGGAGAIPPLHPRSPANGVSVSLAGAMSQAQAQQASQAQAQAQAAHARGSITGPSGFVAGSQPPLDQSTRAKINPNLHRQPSSPKQFEAPHGGYNGSGEAELPTNLQLVQHPHDPHAQAHGMHHLHIHGGNQQHHSEQPHAQHGQQPQPQHGMHSLHIGAHGHQHPDHHQQQHHDPSHNAHIIQKARPAALFLSDSEPSANIHVQAPSANISLQKPLVPEVKISTSGDKQPQPTQSQSQSEERVRAPSMSIDQIRALMHADEQAKAAAAAASVAKAPAVKFHASQPGPAVNVAATATAPTVSVQKTVAPQSGAVVGGSTGAAKVGGGAVQIVAPQIATPQIVVGGGVGGAQVGGGSISVGGGGGAVPAVASSPSNNAQSGAVVDASASPASSRAFSSAASLGSRFDPKSSSHQNRVALLAQFSSLRVSNTGGTLIKHGGSGRPHKSACRIVDGAFYWNYSTKKDATNKNVPLITVSAVLAGRRSADHRRSSAASDEHLCFVIVAPSKQLSMQVTGTQQDRDMWVAGLTIMIENLRQEQEFWTTDKVMEK